MSTPNIPPVTDFAQVTHDTLGTCHFEQWSIHATPFDLPDPRTVQGVVTFDTETSGLHPDDGSRVSVVSVAFRAPETPSEPTNAGDTLSGHGRPQGSPRRYISAAFPFGQGPDDDRYGLSEEHWKYLVYWLNHAGAGLVGHNIKFDLIQMANCSIEGFPGHDYTDRAIYDTMVGQFEIEPTHSVALKRVAARLWGEDADEEQRALQPFLGPKSNPRFDLVPWSVMFPYARRDAELTAALFEHHFDLFDESTLHGGFVPLEMDVVRALTRMELAGLPYHASASRLAAHQLTAQMDRIRESLPFKPTPVGSRKYFFNAPDDPDFPGLGLKPLEYTKTGNPSTSASVVRRLAAQDAPHASTLLEYNRYSSAVSKWYRPFADGSGSDSRIRTSFRHVGGTKSGRLSSTRINLQAVPKDYALDLPVPTPRQLMARQVHDHLPGWGLYETDLMQAELRVAAAYAQVTPMLDALADGRDVHSETATQLFGVGPEHPDWGVYRSLAKRANFSLIFGAGPQTFHQSLVDSGNPMPFPEVRSLVYGWRDLYPQFGAAIQYHMAFCDDYGYVEVVQGRRRYYSPDEDTHSAFNQVVQSSLALFAKEWTVQTDRYTRSLGHPHRGQLAGVGRSGLLLTIHDSQVLLLPEDEGDQIMQHIDRECARLWDFYFPEVAGGSEYERWA